MASVFTHFLPVIVAGAGGWLTGAAADVTAFCVTHAFGQVGWDLGSGGSVARLGKGHKNPRLKLGVWHLISRPVQNPGAMIDRDVQEMRKGGITPLGSEMLGGLCCHIGPRCRVLRPKGE